MRLPRPGFQPGNRQHGLALAGAILLVVVTFSAFAQSTNPSVARNLPATAEIRFQCTSTLHDFEGHVPAQPFVLTLVSNTWSAKSDVLAGEMNTAHDRRDRNLWKMLSASAYPRLSGEVRPSAVPRDTGTNAVLVLRIRDEQQTLPVEITGWTETAETVQFHAAWDVSLKQFGLKPPSVVGVIRVGDRVHLDAQVTAHKTNTPTNVPHAKPVSISNP